MHREVNQGKKVNAIIISLLAITFALYIYQYTMISVGNNKGVKISISIALILGTVFILFKEIKKCKISYKYSIISDKLIINKINNKEAENVESLKIKDIVYIGEKSNVPKEYIRGKINKHYIRNFDNNKKLVCIYIKNNKVCKFMFEPSSLLEKRIKSIIL